MNTLAIFGPSTPSPDQRSRLRRSESAASGAFTFTVAGYPEVEALLASFREANIAVKEMKLGEADLERAFLKLTSKSAEVAA